MDYLKSQINKYVDHRTRLDKDLFSSFEMRNECLRELEKFTPRNEDETDTKMRYIRKFQVALVENRSAGNVKFYTTQLLAKEEEKERGLSDTQRKLNEMIKEMRKQAPEMKKEGTEQKKKEGTEQKKKEVTEQKKEGNNNETVSSSMAKSSPLGRHTRWDDRGEHKSDQKRQKAEQDYDQDVKHGYGSNQNNHDNGGNDGYKNRNPGNYRRGQHHRFNNDRRNNWRENWSN
jgi:hypothetical protein